MTTLNTAEILDNGAVLTKPDAIVDLELEGDLGLFYCSNADGRLETDWAQFDTRQERDDALLRTVGLFVKAGWTLAGDA